MVYMAGDNNLSDAADRDVEELRRVGSSDQVNVVAEVDNAGPRGTRRIHFGRGGVTDGGAGETVVDIGETDSGAPEVLADFIAWATSNFPAERYALVLWNHGGGWEPTEVDRIAQEVGTPGLAPGEAAERSASSLGRVLFRTSLERIFALPTIEERAICSDDGTGNSLDMIELEAVLSEAVRRIGRPFDVLGMDACLMSNLEVAYQVAPFARYLVASEEIEPNQGWPYDVVLARLKAQPDMDGAALVTAVVADYMAYYAADGQTPVTQAALDLSRIDLLTAPLDALADTLADAMPGAAGHVWAAQRASARFHNNTLWDIDHFCAALAEQAPEAYTVAAAAVRDALAPGPDRLVLASGAAGDKVKSCGGVSVYLLPNVLDLSPFYSEVRFAARHRWLNMLEAYHAS